MWLRSQKNIVLFSPTYLPLVLLLSIDENTHSCFVQIQKKNTHTVFQKMCVYIYVPIYIYTDVPFLKELTYMQNLYMFLYVYRNIYEYRQTYIYFFPQRTEDFCTRER